MAAHQTDCRPGALRVTGGAINGLLEDEIHLAQTLGADALLQGNVDHLKLKFHILGGRKEPKPGGLGQF